MQTVVEAPTVSDQPEQSSLNRSVDLRQVPAEWFAWFGVTAVMLAIRLLGRTAWPLSPAESGIANDAWLLQQGGDVSAAADAHPLLVQITGLMFFIFGDTDYTARLIPLIAGIGIIATLFWLRRWIGNLPALSTAILWTLSPVMVMSSLRLDGGAILALSSLLILGTVFVMAVEPGPGKPVALGIALAVAITAHPIGWLVALFTLVPALLLIRKPGLQGHLTRLGASFAITFLLTVTWFASRPSAVLDFFQESLGTLWNDHLAALGSDWPLTVLLLIVDEPLIVFLAVVALVMAFVPPGWSTSAHPALVISCAAWAAPMLTLGILLDGKSPAIYSATLFPLVLVAGLGLSAVLDGVSTARSGRAVPVIVWVLVVAVLLVALARLSGHLIQGPGDNTIMWSISALALALLIILPLAYAVYRITPRIGRHVLPVTLLALVVVLAVPALRGSILLTSTGSDQTGEVLLAGAATPAVGELQTRISRYSRDVTMYDRDARDLSGGHGMVIVLDEQVQNPFQWYFREYPDLEIVDMPEDLSDSVQPDMVFVDQSNQDEFMTALDGYESRSYATRFKLADTEEGSNYASLLGEAVNPLEFGSLVDFVLRRDGATLLEYENLTLMVHEDHADELWGGLAE